MKTFIEEYVKSNLIKSYELQEKRKLRSINAWNSIKFGNGSSFRNHKISVAMYLEEDLTLKRYVMNNLLHIKNMRFDVYQGKIDLVSALLNVQFHFPLIEDENAGIYKIILSNNSWYIGKSKNIIKRIWEHLCETLKLDATESWVTLHNKDLYRNIYNDLVSKNRIIVLKLSNNIEEEYEMLDLHLSIDNNYCHNKVKNHRIKLNKQL